jgi:predicted phosphodiesterase
MVWNENRVIEIGEYVDKHGKPDAVEHFKLKAETIKRYYTWYQDLIGSIQKRDQENITIKKLLEKFTPQELKAIADGKSLDTRKTKEKVTFDSDQVTICYVTDTHWGAMHSPIEWWDSVLEECHRMDVEMILHGGDLIEGMSNRPDQVYGLTHIGFSAQMDLAEELLAMSELPIYIIDGNHDRWGIKSGGIFAVKDVAARLEHVTFLGHDEGDLEINGTIWRMWHGEDGSSYATSYRLQKVIESFTGGEKPNVLLAGHVHKQGYFFERNIHAVSGGALCKQSSWMRSKRLANHSGFHIIKAGIADGEIKWFEPRWYPFYK